MAEETITRDPVCGMTVEPKEAAGKSRFGEWTYLFCSPGCKSDFDADPVKYLLEK
jgi:Cu+-exporting ATPase